MTDHQKLPASPPSRPFASTSARLIDALTSGPARPSPNEPDVAARSNDIMTAVTLDTLAEVGGALAHPGRLRILALLREGGLYVCQIRTVLGLPASTTSVHLAVLRRAGLVSEDKSGRWVHYRLTTSEPLGSVTREFLHLIKDDGRIVADADLALRVRRVGVGALCRAGLDLVQHGITGRTCRQRKDGIHG